MALGWAREAPPSTSIPLLITGVAAAAAAAAAAAEDDDVAASGTESLSLAEDGDGDFPFPLVRAPIFGGDAEAEEEGCRWLWWLEGETETTDEGVLGLPLLSLLFSYGLKETWRHDK